jgi:quercetin dioxygenase-like cupin family protein
VLTFKARSYQSGGELTAIETVAAPGEGPPLHLHSEDEFVYILEGSFRVKVGDKLIEAGPGSFLIPGGTPHTWQNVGDARARFFAGVMPAAISSPATPGCPPKSGAPRHSRAWRRRRRRSRSSDRRSRSPDPADPAASGTTSRASDPGRRMRSTSAR